jgi:hypothetical protein
MKVRKARIHNNTNTTTNDVPFFEPIKLPERWTRSFVIIT